jgi:hypothetical protein
VASPVPHFGSGRRAVHRVVVCYGAFLILYMATAPRELPDGLMGMKFQQPKRMSIFNLAVGFRIQITAF